MFIRCMRESRLWCLGVLLLPFSVVLISCASTQSTSTWVDERYNRGVSRVLVIGMSSNEGRRRIFEDTMVSRLGSKGVTATSSAIVMPTNKILGREVIKEFVEENGFDAVLVTRLVSVDKESRYVPSHTGRGVTPYGHRSFYGYYHHAYYDTYSPGYIVDDTIVTLETKLYDTESSRLVWSMTSETFNPGNVEKVINELSDIIVNRLSRDGLIK